MPNNTQLSVKLWGFGESEAYERLELILGWKNIYPIVHMVRTAVRRTGWSIQWLWSRRCRDWLLSVTWLYLSRKDEKWGPFPSAAPKIYQQVFILGKLRLYCNTPVRNAHYLATLDVKSESPCHVSGQAAHPFPVQVTQDSTETCAHSN